MVPARLFFRQPGLGAVERLDLTFLVDAEHQGFVRRVEVEADEVLHLLDELLCGSHPSRARETSHTPKQSAV